MNFFARFPLRGRPLFVYLGGSCQNVQVGLGWAIVGGWLGGWLGALSYCQIVSCWIRVGLVLLSIEGRADVFFVGFFFLAILRGCTFWCSFRDCGESAQDG